jgi:hypothetical protein
LPSVEGEGRQNVPETEVDLMQTKAKNTDTDLCDDGLNEELAGILTAISIVSKRLAQKLSVLQRRDERSEKGGDQDEQDE